MAMVPIRANKSECRPPIGGFPYEPIIGEIIQCPMCKLMGVVIGKESRQGLSGLPFMIIRILHEHQVRTGEDVLTFPGLHPLATNEAAKTCPECGGKGTVELFTSVRPCSRGCKR